MEKDLRPRQEGKFNFSIVVTSNGMQKNLNQFALCTNILLPQNIIIMFIKLIIFLNEDWPIGVVLYFSRYFFIYKQNREGERK